jgi:hypothetical protein
MRSVRALPSVITTIMDQKVVKTVELVTVVYHVAEPQNIHVDHFPRRAFATFFPLQFMMNVMLETVVDSIKR